MKQPFPNRRLQIEIGFILIYQCVMCALHKGQKLVFVAFYTCQKAFHSLIITKAL